MLREKLNEAMKDAMRARDQAALGTIRLILAKLKDTDIASRTEASREGVADDKILSMLQGMIKQRNESIVLYEKGNRADLADKEKAEIAVIERFLPQQMDEAAVEAAVKEAVASSGAKSIKDMGGVMAALKAKYAGPDGLRQGLGRGEEDAGRLRAWPTTWSLPSGSAICWRTAHDVARAQDDGRPLLHGEGWHVLRRERSRRAAGARRPRGPATPDSRAARAADGDGRAATSPPSCA